MKPFVPPGYLAFNQAINRVAAIRNEQRREAGETLQQLLYAGRVPVKTITKNGALIETPLHIWGGGQWDEALRFNRIKFPYGFDVPISGRPVISRDALEAAFNRDGTVKEEPEPVAPEPSEVPRTKQLKRGPKSKYQWETFTHEVTRRAALDGLPDTLADAERMMAEWCENQWGEQPAPSMIREKLSPLYRYLRDQGYIKS